MSNNSNSNSNSSNSSENRSANSSNNHPTNLVQFESQEKKHKYGLDKFPDVPTERLLVAARDILKTMYPPSYSRQTDIQFMALQYWAEMCVELIGMRIRALDNRIDNCGK
jgi:hypothetical protein